MNVHTFKDAVTSRRDALANDLEDEDDEDEGETTTKLRDSVDGEEDEGRDKFNDAGEVLEPFNLKDEREGGHFDENMNYVWQKEGGEVDTWLADMDETTMEKSIGEAAAALKRKNDKRDAEEEAAPVDAKSLKIELLDLLQPEETILSAMRRMGRGRNKKTGKSNGKSSDPSPSDDASKSIGRLTEIADLLLGNGELNVYDLTREALELGDIRWEYKGHDGSIHGPFSSKDIAQWKAQGYFTGATSVLLRRSRGGGGEGESKEDGGPDRKRARKAAHEEVLGDFEDSDDDEDKPKEPATATKPDMDKFDEWTSSDQIDFSFALPTADHSSTVDTSLNI